MNQMLRPVSYKAYRRVAWLATAFAFCVIVFGAFVRLSDAGLSCPDWPTCYGRVAWPTSTHDIANHAATAIRPLQPHKAWREQVHRMLAGTLGMLVLVLALWAARSRRWGVVQIVGAAALIAIAIPAYMHGRHGLATLLAVLGEAWLLACALCWTRTPDAARSGPLQLQSLSPVATLALATVVFQALLGMWTVTLLLKPVVVMGHLLGGLLTFALLTWLAWWASDAPLRLAEATQLRRWLLVTLVLLCVQIALGGWTSANYAALACGNDFPTCVGRWWPPHDFREAFVLWRGVGVDYEGGVLDGAARIAIQLAHRMMAGVAFVALLAMALRLLRTPGLRYWGALLAVLACAQVALGIGNVKLGLPLPVAVLHNAGAALLLFTLVTLLARLRKPV